MKSIMLVSPLISGHRRLPQPFDIPTVSGVCSRDSLLFARLHPARNAIVYMLSRLHPRARGAGAAGRSRQASRDEDCVVLCVRRCWLTCAEPLSQCCPISLYLVAMARRGRCQRLCLRRRQTRGVDMADAPGALSDGSVRLSEAIAACSSLRRVQRVYYLLWYR